MSYTDYGISVAEDFQKYLKTGDESLIASYSSRELKNAISKLSPHYGNNKLWYRVIEDRIQGLDSKQDAKRRQSSKWRENFKEQWLDRILAYLLGILSGFAVISFQLT